MTIEEIFLALYENVTDSTAWDEALVKVQQEFNYAQNRAFIQGAACAITSTIRTHGIDTGLREAFQTCIGSMDNAINAECDDYDLEILIQHFK